MGRARGNDWSRNQWNGIIYIKHMVSMVSMCHMVSMVSRCFDAVPFGTFLTLL
jgi:hypothetical protein